MERLNDLPKGIQLTNGSIWYQNMRFYFLLSLLKNLLDKRIKIL